jgi:hypothetical protein
MKRRVVASKENKKALRLLQTAGRARPPVTMIVDLSFVRAVARAVSLAPSLEEELCGPSASTLTAFCTSRLEDLPLRVVVTASSKAACERWATTTVSTAAAQPTGVPPAASGKKGAASSTAAASGSAGADAPAHAVTENAAHVALVRRLMKEAELWSPPPSTVVKGQLPSEERAIADAVVFGRPSLEARPADALPARFSMTLVATHSPDVRTAVTRLVQSTNTQIARSAAAAQVRVVAGFVRALTQPFSLRVDAPSEILDQAQSVEPTAGARRPRSEGDDGSAAGPTTTANAARMTRNGVVLGRSDVAFLQRLQQQNALSFAESRALGSVGWATAKHAKALRSQAEEAADAGGSSGPSTVPAAAAASGSTSADASTEAAARLVAAVAASAETEMDGDAGLAAPQQQRKGYTPPAANPLRPAGVARDAHRRVRLDLSSTPHLTVLPSTSRGGAAAAAAATSGSAGAEAAPRYQRALPTRHSGAAGTQQSNGGGKKGAPHQPQNLQRANPLATKKKTVREVYRADVE